MRQDYTPVVGAAGSTSGTITPDFNAYSQYNVEGLTGGITMASPTSALQNGRRRVLRIKDNGTSRTISWDSAYRAVGVTLPASTTAGKALYIGLIYCAADSKWDAVALSLEA